MLPTPAALPGLVSCQCALNDGDQVLVVLLPCLHVCSVAFPLGLMLSVREHATVAAAEQQRWLLLQRLWAQMLVP